MTTNILLSILAFVFFLCGYYLSKNPDYTLLIDESSFLSFIFRIFPKMFYILAVLMISLVIVDFIIPSFSDTFRMYMLYVLSLIIIGAGIYAGIEYITNKK